MTSVRIRPRFQIQSHLSTEEIRERLQSEKESGMCPCSVTFAHNMIHIKMPNQEQHFWSPQLDLSLEEEEGQTVVRGYYGPKPTVWTVFAFMYAAVGILGLFALIYGFVQLTFGTSPWALWVLVALSLLAVGLYFSSQAGQKLGAEDTFRIHIFIERIFESKIHIH
ncbi:DUF5336 domain-containing protein [Reichenbachiella agariperforans]|uniref:DUF5336 domain-containing protein n=1 Tax=Reichenbachiella agariperforans TaxID=156994 RepID=UPI001C099FE9|nr:DUF5336 domain-containing protein [Reichenbachiella agariperforans]MBU2915627.1 hypothetical protein [Reichenbachiella agariperforans]